MEPLPSPPALLHEPCVQACNGSLSLRLAVDQVCTLHLMVLPRWKKAASISFRGELAPSPTGAEVMEGRGVRGVKALAAFSCELTSSHQVLPAPFRECVTCWLHTAPLVVGAHVASRGPARWR